MVRALYLVWLNLSRSVLATNGEAIKVREARGCGYMKVFRTGSVISSGPILRLIPYMFKEKTYGRNKP
jgi:hypothetical protein